MVADRVGDYVHCMTRLVNAAYRRVAGDVCEPTVRALLRDTLVEVAQAARALPVAERIGPASSRQGSLDITTAVYLVRTVGLHARIGDILRLSDHPPVEYGHGRLAYHGAVRLTLNTLRRLLDLWSQPQLFTAADLVAHLAVVTDLGKLWNALHWSVTPWLHWTIPGRLMVSGSIISYLIL